jgi:hypothetical protein
MRFAWFLSFILLGSWAGAQINPQTNINWPPGCRLYDVSTNTCVAPGGTAANPAGAPGQVQYNLDNVIMGAGPAKADSAGNFQASVNSQINVMMYGAKGDCTTDDHNAIIAAQTVAQAYTPPAVIYFPKPPGGCYLTSVIDWHGVSMQGQPMGAGINGTNGFGVTIKSKPGQDILHVADPTTSNTIFNRSWTIRDLAFQVDGSAAVSYPHRWPGRWFDDAAMTSGSAVFSSSAAGVSCGDVGQAIKVAGAGTAGADLITTIASVSPCWGTANNGWGNVTLAAAASTTVSAAHAYISLLGLPVTTTIGNCAIAMDMVDGNPAHWINTGFQVPPVYDSILNVSFGGTGGFTNPTCGIYTQGGFGPYGLDVRNFLFASLIYGVVQGSSELNSFFQSDSNDFQKWDHGDFTTMTYPWISYNGGYNTITDVELSALAGPQLLNLGNRWSDNNDNMHLDIREFEHQAAPLPYGYHISGAKGAIFEGTSFTNDPSQTAYLDTYSTRCDLCMSTGTVQIGGTGNYVTLKDNALPVWTDAGRGNVVTSTWVSNPFRSMQSNYEISLLPYKGETRVFGRVTSDFIRDGNLSTPYNMNDLLLWPQDFIFQSSQGAYGNYYVTDATSPSGSAFIFRHNQTFVNFAQFANSQITVGTTIPAAKANIYLYAKCLAGATTLSLNVLVNNVSIGIPTPACSASYQVITIPVDFTGTSGALSFRNQSSTLEYQIGWMAIRPYLGDVNTAKVTTGNLASGTASNTDLTGRLTLTAATTGSYTFAITTYTTANCFWQPRFNIAGVNWWDTSTGTTASVTTSAAVTGTFAYHCVIQN